MGLPRIAAAVGLVAVLPTILNFVLLYPGYPVHTGGGILITGASSGIGKHAALTLADRGFVVFAGVRKAADGEKLRQENAALVPVIIDVTNKDQIEAAVGTVRAALRERGNLPLAAIVNNAGVADTTPLELVKESTVRWVYEVNVFGVFRVTQAFLPLLRESTGGGAGARIVNIGSIAGVSAFEGQAVYSGTKFALEGMSDALRRELHAWRISVSVLQPGFVHSEITKGLARFGAAEMPDLTEAQRALYGGSSRLAEVGARLAVHSDSPAVTSTAIVDAIENPYPQTKYAVANVDRMPAAFIKLMCTLLPERAWDFVVRFSMDDPLRCTAILLPCIITAAYVIGLVLSKLP
eukprot:g5673.t1